MNISVCQRIILTMTTILVLFLITSVVAYNSFNSVSAQVGSVIHEASPRVSISGNLRSNLSDTKYILLEYMTGKKNPEQDEITDVLQGLSEAFEQDFNALTSIEANNPALQEMQAVTAKIFQHSESIVAEKSRYWSQQAAIKKQADQYKYLSGEIVYTLEDLLHEEFRYEFLKVVKPIRDDIAYMASKVAKLLQETEPQQALLSYADIEKYLALVDQALPNVEAVDQEAFESIVETWQPYREQLVNEGLTVHSHLQSLAAMQRTEQLLADIEVLVERNEGLIAQFIDAAKAQAKSVELETDSTIYQGKVLIAAGALLAAACSLFFGYKLVAHIQKSLSQVVSGLSRIAGGDLAARVSVQGNDEFSALSQSTNSLAKELRFIVDQIVTTVGEVHHTSKMTSDISSKTLEGVEQQSLQSARLAATATEMEANATEVASHAGKTLADAVEAEAILENSNTTLLQNRQSMNGLSEQVTVSMDEVRKLQQHSDAIGEVVHVIKDIAEKTNLLALNAAIEAARAGETGRGFSVVADEVRSLASRTQGSVSTIENMVATLQSGAEKTVAAMAKSCMETSTCINQMDKSMGELNKVSNAVLRIREMNSQVAQATDEQSATVGDISQSLTEINTIMAATTHGAETAAEQSEALLNLSDKLAHTVKRFSV
ncbi:MAG: methyl-accepting chemotaxis protein [Amphritea sp.]